MKRKVFPVNQIWLIAGQPRQTERPQQEETPLEEWGIDVPTWVPSKLPSGQLLGSLVFAIVREAFHLQTGWAVDWGRWQGEEGRVVEGRSRRGGDAAGTSVGDLNVPAIHSRSVHRDFPQFKPSPGLGSRFFSAVWRH